MRFPGYSAAYTGHRCKRNVGERRQYPAHKKQENKPGQAGFRDRPAVIKNVLDRRKPERYHTGKNDAVENIVEIPPEKDKKYQQTDTL